MVNGKNWDTESLPKFDDLPSFHEYTGCAWGVWGEGNQLGTINLLTDTIVKAAAKENIQYVVLYTILSTRTGP